jgi:ribosomal protein S18 acetylase RimI-like enzyme
VDKQHYIKEIVMGMELYFRAFSMADNMRYSTGDIEWIAPLPHATGPSLVFKIDLDEKTALHRLDELVPEIWAGQLPALWLISPTSTPRNLLDLLLSKGFQNLTNLQHPEPEPGMALDLSRICPSIQENSDVNVKKVNTLTEFAIWVDVVNEALHGWPMLTSEHYSPWIACREMSLFLAYLNKTPVATVATIQNQDTASIEFVSTLKVYRNLGVATTICLKAMRELIEKGVKTVTLRSSYEAIRLYKKLGFLPYYEQILLSYPRQNSCG